MARLRWSTAAIVLAGCSLLTLLTMQPGLDYWGDSGSIDALVRGDWANFFSQQPLMGPVSLVVRAPFVALRFHGALSTVYFLGVIPCYLALLALGAVLWRRTAGRPVAERATIVGACLASPMAIRAIHWGHPEDLLCTALCIGALLAAANERAVIAGVLLGLGFTTKQWAIVAALPVLLALPGRRGVFTGVAAAVGALLTLPMLIGDPSRFWMVQHAAGSGDPSAALGLRAPGFPAGRVMPQSVWMPLAAPRTVGGDEFYFAGPIVARLSHPLILLAGLPLAWPLWRRPRVTRTDALRLLALVLAVRAALDTNDLDYYHAPLVAALATLAAFGGERELRMTVFAGLGLTLAFVQPATSLAEQSQFAWPKWIAYMATLLPLAWCLARDLYVAERTGRPSPAPSATPLMLET